MKGDTHTCIYSMYVRVCVSGRTTDNTFTRRRRKERERERVAGAGARGLVAS